MEYKIVSLTSEYLDSLRQDGNTMSENRNYLTDGSVGYCLLADGKPVFAGGVVTMGWKRGEAWILPTPFFRKNLRLCYRYVRDILPLAAVQGHFRRIQATCAITVNVLLFEHLKFEREGVMKAAGPNGEDCHLYAKVFTK